MFTRFQIIGLIISLLWLFVVAELVRRKKLMGGYSLIWLFFGTLLVVFSLWEGLLIKITHWVGFVYPPSTFFAIVIIFLTIILLDFSLKLSRLTRQNKELAQKMALLELRCKDKKNEK